MITAETMINYGSYTISRYTYSADVSATGKELTCMRYMTIPLMT